MHLKPGFGWSNILIVSSLQFYTDKLTVLTKSIQSKGSLWLENPLALAGYFISVVSRWQKAFWKSRKTEVFWGTKCVLLFSCHPFSRLDARRLQIERLWRHCLCGRLKQGGGDSSRALWGHLWNRLTNVSLLCHKDTRLTKLAINASFTTHLFVSQVFIPLVSCTVLPWLTRPGAIFRSSSKEGGPRGTIKNDSCRILMACSSHSPAAY